MHLLTESQANLISTALFHRAEDMDKLADDCASNFAAYSALTPEQKAKYDEPKLPEQVGTDGIRRIDCSPHPRAYAQMERLFREQAHEAMKLYGVLESAPCLAMLKDEEIL
jgi:hypothetical protein